MTKSKIKLKKIEKKQVRAHLAFRFKQKGDVGEDSACYQSGYRGSTRVSSQHVRLQQDTRTPANLQPGSEPALAIISYFSNIIENVMKLPHNLNFKNNFLGKYVRRQIDKIAKSWHIEIEIRIRK